jgi:flagellar hook-length control protein FliK
MMASLPQTPTQTGLASILAALGQAAPAGTPTSTPGFEQLFAALPATTETATMATLPTTSAPISAPASVATPGIEGQAAAATTPPAAALFGLIQPAADAPVANALPAEATAKAPTAPKAETRPATDTAEAAAAATLLIAVATPMKPAAPAANDKAVVGTDADAPDGGEAEAPAPAVAVPLPATAVVEAPVAATVIAAAMPTADKPVAEKASKPVANAPTARNMEAATTTMAATPKAIETAQPQSAPLAAAEPKAAKPLVDAAASMTVLFAQPATQGSATIAQAAQPVPVAERTLDMTSDDQWIAQLAADIAATKSDKGDISFRLMPRHLGRLDVSMLAGDEGVTVKLDTHHEATATIVQAAQPRLVEDLRQQGVRVAETQVTHTPAETGRQQQNQSQARGNAPDASHLIETAADQADPSHDERTADRRGRFA